MGMGTGQRPPSFGGYRTSFNGAPPSDWRMTMADLLAHGPLRHITPLPPTQNPMGPGGTTNVPDVMSYAAQSPSPWTAPQVSSPAPAPVTSPSVPQIPPAAPPQAQPSYGSPFLATRGPGGPTLFPGVMSY